MGNEMLSFYIMQRKKEPGDEPVPWFIMSTYYDQTSTNSHLSTLVTFWVQVESPHVHYYFNLSTMSPRQRQWP